MTESKKVNTVKRFSGWVPDLPDHRDKMYGALRKAPAKLPSAVDLRPTCSPVEDQGQLGSCTGNALVGALEFLEMKNKDSFIDLSRLFVYYNERVMEHTIHSDSGAMIRDGIKTLVNRLSQNELNSTIGINSTKTAAQNGYELFLGVNNKIYMPL
jgi:C1A family cysteine protease